MPAMTAWAFVLAVPDIERSARYFRDVLGFRIGWEEATDWRLVERDGVRIMLGRCPDDLHPRALGSHNLVGYLEVDDVDGLYADSTAVARCRARPGIPTTACMRLSSPRRMATGWYLDSRRNGADAARRRQTVNGCFRTAEFGRTLQASSGRSPGIVLPVAAGAVTRWRRPGQ